MSVSFTNYLASLFGYQPIPTSAGSSSASAPEGATASSIAPADGGADPTIVLALASSTSAAEPAKKVAYFDTFKGCLTNPDKTVLKYPIQSLVYHVAIKILFYSIAQSFPIFGWAAIAFSAALFDRVVLLNPKKYVSAITEIIKDAGKSISAKWHKKPPAPAVSGTPSSSPPAPAASGTPSSSLPPSAPASSASESSSSASASAATTAMRGEREGEVSF